VPKLIVVFYGDDDDAPAIAESAVAGAKTIRFTEVDLRAGTATATRHQRLGSAETVAEYDGVVIVAPAGTTHADLAALLENLERDGRAVNTVFALPGGDVRLLERVARTGGVIVTIPLPAD